MALAWTTRGCYVDACVAQLKTHKGGSIRAIGSGSDGRDRSGLSSPWRQWTLGKAAALHRRPRWRRDGTMEVDGALVKLNEEDHTKLTPLLIGPESNSGELSTREPWRR